MNISCFNAVIAVAILTTNDSALAEGALNIFNWGNYTNPNLIEKFEKEYDVNVTITDYDSNETALAKIKTGEHEFDIVVPSANYIPIWINEGLLLETRPDQMENFKHIDPRWIDVDWDPGNRYTVPWQWGTTGVTVNTSVYKGDVNTSSIFLDPPDELAGKINVVPEMADILALALMYVGSEPCTNDREALNRARDVLFEAKAKWTSMDYGNVEKYANGNFAAGVTWNGDSFRARQQNPDIVYGYPKEGYPIWMDSVAVLIDAQNVTNAKLFQNFIMDPENAAMISSFARFANGIQNSDSFLPEDLKTAPEIKIPTNYADKGRFIPTCPPDIQRIYSAIWTDLQK